MKYEMLKEGVGYVGPVSSFKKNLRYSSIVKDFGTAIKEKGLNKAFHDEYLYHESSYDEERFRIINKLALHPKLTVALSEKSSSVLFEGYVKIAPPKEDEYLDEGVSDVIKKIIDWFGDKFAFIFLRGNKRKQLAEKAAADLKENPNALPDKIAAAMREHKELPQANINTIKPAVEAGKQQAMGNNDAAQQYAANIKHPAVKTESFKSFQKGLLTEIGPTITAPESDPISALLVEIWKFIGNIPYVGMVLQGVLGYMGPMLLSMAISQVIYRSLAKAQKKKAEQNGEPKPVPPRH